MNPLVKSIHFILLRINAVLDGLDKKTVDIIKQTFFFIVFILVVIAIIFGATAGKKAAKKSGITITESINDTFEIDIKKKRDEGSFSHILETELRQKEHINKFPKEQYHVREDMHPEVRDRIIETDQNQKLKTRFPQSIQRQELAPSRDIHEEPLMEEKRNYIQPKTAPGQSHDIVSPDTPPLQEESKKKESRKKNTKIQPTHDLKPLLKKNRVTE